MGWLFRGSHITQGDATAAKAADVIVWWIRDLKAWKDTGQREYGGCNERIKRAAAAARFSCRTKIVSNQRPG